MGGLRVAASSTSRGGQPKKGGEAVRQTSFRLGTLSYPIGNWNRGAPPRGHQARRATGAMGEPGTRTGGNQRRRGRYQRRVGLSSGMQAESREAWGTGIPPRTDHVIRPPVTQSQDRG